MSQGQIHVGSADDALGAREQRFFGAGFTRIQHEVADVRLNVAGDLGATARVTLRYPDDWSAKAGQKRLAPHLSTLDALVIAIQLAEVIAVHTLSLSAEHRRWMWVRKCELRSGTAAQEELDAIPSAIRLVRLEQNACPLGLGYIGTFEGSVGSIKVKLTIEMPYAGLDPREQRFDSIDDALDARDARYFGSGYRSRSHHLEGIVRTGCEAATAQLALSEIAQPFLDLESSYGAGVSMVDCAITQAQVAQILMYALDGLDRQDSNTLWMRHAVMESRTPFRPAEHPVMAAARVERTRVLTIGGTQWRSADFSGIVGGISSRYNVAHQLPSTTT